jgi:hypothetical protein
MWTSIFAGMPRDGIIECHTCTCGSASVVSVVLPKRRRYDTISSLKQEIASLVGSDAQWASQPTGSQ